MSSSLEAHTDLVAAVKKAGIVEDSMLWAIDFDKFQNFVTDLATAAAAACLRAAAAEWAADPDAWGDSFADARNTLREKADRLAEQAVASLLDAEI